LYKELLISIEKEKIQVDEELKALEMKMEELSLSNGKEKKAIDLHIEEHISIEISHPLKSILAKPRNGQRTTKHVFFSLDKPQIRFI